jgi:hypothetical protein
VQDDLGTRVRRGLAAAGIGTVIASTLTAVLKSTGNDDLEGAVGIALIVAALAYWAWTKRDEL